MSTEQPQTLTHTQKRYAKNPDRYKSQARAFYWSRKVGYIPTDDQHHFIRWGKAASYILNYLNRFCRPNMPQGGATDFSKVMEEFNKWYKENVDIMSFDRQLESEDESQRT